MDNSDLKARFIKNAQMKAELDKQLQRQNNGKTPNQLILERMNSSKFHVVSETKVDNKVDKDETKSRIKSIFSRPLNITKFKK